MPEDRSPPREAGSGIKPPGKHKWRGKLFSAEGIFSKNVDDLESTEDDVTNFLHAAGPTARVRPQPAHLTPRIDTTAVPRTPATNPVLRSPSIVDVYRPPKPKQNKGSRVAFSAVDPEIIGEGGDEAELPPSEVSVYKHLPARTGPSPRNELSQGSTNQGTRTGRGPSPVPVDDASFRPQPLRRQPTGANEPFDEINSRNHNDISDTNSLSTSPSPPPKLKPLPQPPQQGYQRAVDPEAGSHDFQDDVSPLTEQDSDSDGGIRAHKQFPRKNATSNYLGVSMPETLDGNSITPSPSPKPTKEDREAQSSSYGFPTVDAPKGTMTKPSDIEFDADNRTPRVSPPVTTTKAVSLRQVAKGIGDDSLNDFDARVQRYFNLFRLGVSAHTDLMMVPLVQWMRSASWWFLRGRQGLESNVRAKPEFAQRNDLSSALKQAFVDLAKAWWIVKDITPNHPEITKYGKASVHSVCAMIKSYGDQITAKQAEVHVQIIANMRALSISMKRNGKLPPYELEIQRLDLHVLLEIPQIPSLVVKFLVNNATGNHHQNTIQDPFFPIPIGDTERHFNFGRMFVDISILSDTKEQDLRVPCILSMLRDRSEWGLLVVIASPDGQVNLIISDHLAGALSWHSVQWQIKTYQVVLTITNDPHQQIKLCVDFADKDFKSLWGICDYTQSIRKSFSARRDEDLIFERTLLDFQCDDSQHFPKEVIADCRLRLFERRDGQPIDGKLHNGYRLVVVTPSNMKTVSIVNYDLGREHPILFGTQRSNGLSRLLIRMFPSANRISVVFTVAKDLEIFRHMLSGTLSTSDDVCLSPLELQSLSISPNHATEPLNSAESHSVFKHRWKQLRIVGKKLPSSSKEVPIARSEDIRILADSDVGTLTDRVGFPSSEIQLCLSTENLNEIKILRPPQTGMTWSLADDRVSREEIALICAILKDMLTSSTTRVYHFRTLNDLHSFQAAITGFAVLFDGIVSSFSISRRRSVVPVHKKWEANWARLQILRHEKTVQLVGFFRDFSHGRCMNFVLKVTDVFEVSSKSGLFLLRIVDAKFALPKGDDDESKDFVCLGMPEYPSEHDDITIGFDTESGRLLIFRRQAHSIF